MQHTHERQALGGTRLFHQHVSQTSDDRITNHELTNLRNTLLMRPPSKGSMAVRVEKNMLELNNANDANAYRGVPSSVKGGAFLSLGKRSTSRITSLRATKCHRWQTDSELAHTCDVLGPYACADCIKERMRKQVHDEAARTYPGIKVSERDLCVKSHIENIVESTPQRKGKLSPIIEDERISHTPFLLKGYNSSSSAPSRNSSPSRRYPQYRRPAGQPYYKSINNNNKLLPITNTELQKRVLDKKLRGDGNVSSWSNFTPRGIIQEITEPVLAPPPKIRVDIQIPMVSASRENSKLSFI